ncbi:vanillate O-demethylase oxidoreductase (Vanillate degradation ferredoxin-like protein) [Bradyrhizobium sp. STM 3843]|uniref:PDR/VanB family oxidoreductase n=1 Tax=Bradyrhizobium sp. STM 3843 TaxID=551947 RepID=UPI0002406C13|nr:PDR/VanB family oxidoreductase [Bradyrhizobium sp. STM 3843]CCE06181.1 vanillate O-demethylase oxidoreductase (Vanillate degradation ferredoxin-like protein) [Bradyrhizobium sp. STM 3843]
MTDALHTVVVARKAIEAYNMASFELVPADDQPLPGFTPGSHIDVTLPNGLVRQYSLLNSASERNRYCIGVWKDANSRGGSKTLHIDINEGDRLQVSRPRNRFKIPKTTTRALLLARGIGVTPMLSIADTLKAKNIPFELHYVFALMSPDSFRATIEASAFAESTMFYKESSEDNQLLKPATVLADRPEDTQLFICGVDWWQDPIIALAKQKGFAEERIHVERFTAKAAAALLDKVFEVKIASTGATFKIPGDKSVTAYLEENGVKIATSCEQGMCGTCKTKVVEGEVEHRDKRLSADQRAQGYFLPCVSRAKGDTLVLDL